MGFTSSFKLFDVYRNIPEDLTDATANGGALSIASFLLIAWLVWSELMEYYTPEFEQEVLVQQETKAALLFAASSNLLRINLNITVNRMPCAIVSLDAQDVLGTHRIDVNDENIYKKRLYPDGTPKTDVLGREMFEGKREGHTNNHASKNLTPQEQKGEGCNIYGYVEVNKVPGNLHISAHAHPELLTTFFGNKPMDVSHTIHDLWFGDDERFKMIDNYWEDVSINPLAGVSYTDNFIHEGAGQDIATSFEYYLELVPSAYDDKKGGSVVGYQYVEQSDSMKSRYRIPAVYFRFNLSPLIVRFTVKSQHLSEFIVHLFAITGGVYAVIGILNGSLNAVNAQLARKAEIGKLG